VTSANFNKTVNALAADEFPIIRLQIDHADLETPIRVVNDREDLTSGGHLWQACGFTVAMPSQPETGAPTAQLAVDNVSRELVYWVDTSNGAQGATATLSQVLRSDPDTVEWSLKLNLSNVSMNNQVVTATLAYDDIWNSPACMWTYTPARAPGLF